MTVSTNGPEAGRVLTVRLNSVVQMKFGDICKKLQPHGDIQRFLQKKEIMNAIFGKFVKRIKNNNN